jgi:hypothetical protein
MKGKWKFHCKIIFLSYIMPFSASFSFTRLAANGFRKRILNKLYHHSCAHFPLKTPVIVVTYLYTVMHIHISRGFLSFSREDISILIYLYICMFSSQ